MKVFRAAIGAAVIASVDGANLRSANSRAEFALQAESSASAETAVKQLVESKLGLHQVLNRRSIKETNKAALSKIEGKLPAFVQGLLHSHSKTEPTLDDASKVKARDILNGLIEDYIEEVDGVIIECQAQKNAHRVTFGQVSTDLGRISSELAEAEEKITDNYNCISQMDREYKVINDELTDERSEFERVRAENDAELTLRKNDLAVFNTILNFVKCPAGTYPKLIELQTAKGAKSAHNATYCATADGSGLNFKDAHLNAKVAKSPRLQKAIGQAMASVLMAVDGADESFLQMDSKQEQEQTTPSTTMNIGVTQSPTPVQEEPPASVNVATACRPDGPKPDCGRLTDNLALQWGKFKDLVDELQSEMDRDQDAWDTRRGELNDQMDVISGQKSECQTNFDAATGRRNTLTTESDEKTTQKNGMTFSFNSQMEVCETKITELLFTDICGTYSARNMILGVDARSVIDCQVTDWVAGECSVPCDDSCPRRVGGVIDPFKCGGMTRLTRQIMISPTDTGVKCPSLTRETRCGQAKCPIDCAMSEWSLWSKCTKDCGGGARQRTRSILTKPNHGGKYCDSPIDTEPCNTGSCDLNCVLDDWTAWSPCSMACTPAGQPGFTQRMRHVLTPLRANGMCPDAESPSRLEFNTCNEQACVGDEICVAKQDLVILVDQSGSLKEAGSKIIRNFVANLTGHYRSEYYGTEAVQLGIVTFGNGATSADGSVASALYTAGLTLDLASVKTEVDKIQYQAGFTNLAQAFIQADRMFSLGGRPDAMSAVLVISDGKYSSAFETEKAVNELKEKGTYVYMAPISGSEGQWSTKLKEWASQPWETNYQLLPGLLDVEFNMGLFSSVLIAKFCPEAMSPSLEAAVDERRGYLLVHEQGFPADACGRWYDGGLVETLDQCARNAREWYGYKAFSITEPSEWYNGMRHCYAEAIEVTQAEYQQWLRERAHIVCPAAGTFEASWIHNPMYDVYALDPSMS